LQPEVQQASVEVRAERLKASHSRKLPAATP
jgi:hypothetical protein